jgi:hypothetical protein
LVGTDGGSGSISENTVYSQNKRANGITALAAGERVSISSGSVDGIAIPVVW